MKKLVEIFLYINDFIEVLNNILNKFPSGITSTMLDLAQVILLPKYLEKLQIY